MGTYRVEIGPRGAAASAAEGRQLVATFREAGVTDAASVLPTRLFFIDGNMSRPQVAVVASTLLADPVTELASIVTADEPVPADPAGTLAVEVHPRPGVMDPVAESTLAELRAAGHDVSSVRTGRRYLIAGTADAGRVLEVVGRGLANDCIEQVTLGTTGVHPAPQPPSLPFELRHVAITKLADGELEQLSRSAHLFLSLEEMQAIQAHFRTLGREPTDLEIETLAQTWSEHCVHKTLRSPVHYRGAPLPGVDEGGVAGAPSGEEEGRRYENLLRDTIALVTEELMAAGRGPQCLSVFKDNAGVIVFDDDYGVAFKVETHNHPSAIEPYGGSATGIGGVIRDVIGCGLGAKPIASTDVFCVGPSDWPTDWLPKGVLHPWRVLRGVVRGVADYGNRMGIPTVNGAVYFDPRYLGNPLVYCGSVGLLPRGMVEKAATPGDLVVVIGGRTGRDGIHGATFSSAELTDTHVDEFSHAVQIGNAITEKRFLDAVLQARDADGGCLYTAITDCGAGGLSSAVGEMGEHVGAVIDLEKVPLKYTGLRYDEIWISEAQERMVVAVPAANLERFLKIMQDEEVEATVIGTFGSDACGSGGEACGQPGVQPRLVLRWQGAVVGDLDLTFLHNGVPRRERLAEWWPTTTGAAIAPTPAVADADVLSTLQSELADANNASNEWIIRRYDHEVQGGSVLKPLLGPGRGPGDAAVLRPRYSSSRGIVLGCGLVPHLADVDPYWMAVAALDEALRNVVSVGGDPGCTALLDNFCWGRTDDPQQLGALVRACQACYDAAKANGVPFVSGKDSLNNEFALDDADVEPLLKILREQAEGGGRAARHLRSVLRDIEKRVRTSRRLAIPPTLLISAISVIDDVSRCLTPDLKDAGHTVALVGGLSARGHDLTAAARVHRSVAELIRQRAIVACHDVSNGGWLVALAEMAIAGNRGVDVRVPAEAGVGPFGECCAAYVIETADWPGVRQALEAAGVIGVEVGAVRADCQFACGGHESAVGELYAAWAGQSASGA